MTFTKTMMIGVVSACTLLAMGACSSSSKNHATGPVILTEADANKKISVPVGSTFDVKLQANVTTGYNWQLIEKTGTSVVQNGQMEYATNPHPEGMVGVGGISTFHFSVKHTGPSTLKFGYSRPWEKTAPAKTYVVTVDAK